MDWLWMICAVVYVSWSMNSIVTLNAEVRRLRDAVGLKPVGDDEIRGEDI